MITELYRTEREVEKILEDVPTTRSSDNLLFIAYWIRKAPNISFIDFWTNPKLYKASSYKTVERCRRKVQARRPELRDPKVADARLEKTLEYENYAIN